jgi:hypothetical protein
MKSVCQLMVYGRLILFCITSEYIALFAVDFLITPLDAFLAFTFLLWF